MERVIKFRAWNESTKTMVDLLKITPLALNDSMNTQLALQGMSGLFIPFSSEFKLMQFTGLTDKNGKDMYEGDIVKTSTEKVMQVSWNTHFASFCLDRDGWMFTHYFGEAVEPEFIEIIGNIYENKELIENNN